MDAEFACQQDPENTRMAVEKMRLCADSSAPMAASGCFDCNICLDFAVEPVVTLCGHLYCWPCIYKWLQLESTSPPQCPVCKAALSQTTLVPLYGRGSTGSKASEQNDAADIPSRPSVQHRGHTMAASLVEPEFPRRPHRQRHQQQHNRPLLEDYLVPTVSTRVFHPILGGTAVAVLPWVFGDHMTGHGMYYSSPFYVVGGGSESPRAQRHEMEVRRSLHRISIFLFFFVIICLLLF